MKRIIPIVIALIVLFYGCAGLGYNIKTSGFLSPSHPKIPSKDDTYFVFSTPENAENPILDEEVKFKIQVLLIRNGYKIAHSVDQADWVLTFGYGMTGGTTSSTVIPWTTTQSGSFSAFGSGGIYTGTFSQPSTTYIPVSKTTYGRVLVVSLIDREASLKKDKLVVVWRGESYSRGKSSDLREVLNYLLVHTFHNFGVNTEKEIKRLYFPSDPEVRELKNLTK